MTEKSDKGKSGKIAKSSSKTARESLREQIKNEERRILRDAILTVASREFNNLGYDGVTMEKIAAEAGISVGSIYKIFSSKTALYAEILRSIRNKAMERAAEAIRLSGSPIERARALVAVRVTMFFENHGIARDFIASLIGRQEHLSPELATLPKDIMKDYIGKLAAFFSEIQEKLPAEKQEDPMLLAFLFEGVIHSHFAFWKVTGAPIDDLNSMVDLVMNRILKMGYLTETE
ncbi:MAG: hypothetical protein CVV64_12440 [Candidatus Wallbacteria bacterium HGW-Wallbacteria-1]|uniref:HTH tetR-type domain-containing protein n=1 Tax=Candidatus Wallbacteria bacterium HGW-Wallbacteria-1 TaxID=2013854 RepID=A0A2N1PNA9_9BACT|nr:MAG: hypothetical protein CVV64_12440 [Candidatus Wallbacteria bacterium HGW-Wallbacteria-1]